MGSDAQSGGVGELKRDRGGARPRPLAPTLWGPLSAFGLFVAVLTCLADQAAKFWLLLVVHLNSHGPVALTPFAELVLTWNTGISYGLFPQHGPVGPWALLAFKIVAVVFLWVWLSRAPSRLTALALGLDHRRGGRQRHRPAALARGHGFRAAARGNLRALAFAGTCLTSPTWPSLRGLSDSYMNRCARGVPQKRPDRVYKGLHWGILWGPRPSGKRAAPAL